MLDSNLGREGGGDTALGPELSGAIMVHGPDATQEVRRDAKLAGEDLPKKEAGDSIVRLLQVNECDRKGATTGCRSLEKVGHWQLVVFQAVAGTKPGLLSSSPGWPRVFGSCGEAVQHQQ